MGYEKVYNLEALKGWVDRSGEAERMTGTLFAPD
jgi:hypothetical protein